MKIRNPWSSETFCGKGSDTDFEFWTSDLLRQANHQVEDDGCFYLTIEDFHQSVLYLTVNYYHPGWVHNYIQNIADDGGSKVFLFDVEPYQAG